MRCPWCGWEGQVRGLHAHLAEAHGEQVRLGETEGGRFYEVECPVCGAAYRQGVKPRSRDPRFVEEYRDQVRLVAFDMLINHLLVEHEQLRASGSE